MSDELKQMGKYAIGTVSLAGITLMGIAVVTGFKNTNLVDNTTAQYFVTGLTTFGIFMGLITLAIVAKIIIKIVKGTDDEN